MDIFIDKFAQRKNAQEMIKANYMAEAEENERLTSKLHHYDEVLQDMRRLSSQNMENAEKVKNLLDESVKKIQEIQSESSNDDCVLEAMKEQQAAIEEMMLTQKRIMEDLEKASEDFMHKESVKVYRNVQAFLEEELPKQTNDITEKVGQIVGEIKVGKGILPICILTLLAALANIGVLVAHLWGLL